MKRTNKQIVYGAVYLACWTAIGYGVYVATLKPAASCFDNKLNQDETEVDCGGQFCESCDIRRLLPLRVASVALAPAGSDDRATAVVEFQNPNPQYGAVSFKYKIEFFGAANALLHIEEGETFIYPSEVKDKAFVSLPFNASSVASHTETITDVQWKSAENLSVPKIQTREIKLSVQNGQATITGIVRNNSVFGISSAIVSGFVLDTGQKVIGASRTSIQDITPTEERFFQVVMPLAPGSELGGGLVPRVSVEARR